MINKPMTSNENTPFLFTAVGNKPSGTLHNKSMSSHTVKYALGANPSKTILPQKVNASSAFTTRTGGSSMPVMSAIKNSSENNLPFHGANNTQSMDQGTSMSMKLGDNLGNAPTVSRKTVATSGLFSTKSRFVGGATPSNANMAFGGVRPSSVKRMSKM